MRNIKQVVYVCTLYMQGSLSKCTKKISNIRGTATYKSAMFMYTTMHHTTATSSTSGKKNDGREQKAKQTRFTNASTLS